MIDDIKKEFSSFKLLSILLSIAVSIYLLQYFLHLLQQFSDVILIFVFAWLLSFILDPIVYGISKRTKIPVVLSTAIVFLLFAGLIGLLLFIFLPSVANQVQQFAKILPKYAEHAPAFVQRLDKTITPYLNDYTSFLPSLAQFFLNFVTVLILSFYLIIEKEEINKRLFKLAPKRWHENIRFIQKAVGQTFASFLRIQIIFGIVAGVITWIVLVVSGLGSYAASTSLLAGILAMVPMIGPVLGLIPPLLVSFITDPSRAVIILLILLISQQLIFNIFGAKIIGNAFKINPVVVVLSLLIGLKVAGLIGGVFAVPLVSIVVIVGEELYNYYFKEKE